MHLLAVYYGAKLSKHDTLEEILQAYDSAELIAWLRHRPLFHYDPKINYALCHAGLAANWTVQDAIMLSREMETCLQSNDIHLFLANMYGNFPDYWSSKLTGIDRLRAITNYFTRLRFCDVNGKMHFDYKETIANKPANVVPWYEVPNRKNLDVKIIFGHWAALLGITNCKNTYALDTGCVWGNYLTAMCLETEERFQVRKI